MSSPSAIDALLRDYDSGEYFSRLVNQPAPHRWRKAPEVIYHAALNALEARFTVVMPTFNHASNIHDALDATATAASLPFDCIVVDDGSEDGTVERVQSFFQSGRSHLLARATIIRNPVPVYETACDNLGFTLAETEIVVEVQADIQTREPAFDALFLRALSTSPPPSAISGRCGHTFRLLDSRARVSSWFRRRSRDVVGLCGKTIERPEAVEVLKGHIYRCETVNRGPWLLLKRDLERHGYLDERHFFQGNDDHDFHRRLLEAGGRRPLYVPISLHAPLALGAVRRRRTGINRDVYNMLSAEKRGSPAFHNFLDSLRSSLAPEAIV
jgi:glycosyltransferase involved in cell wall biosynthesis